MKIANGNYINLQKIDYLAIDKFNSICGYINTKTYIIKHCIDIKEAEKELHKIIFKINELFGGQI
jgi:hypothetical protein